MGSEASLPSGRDGRDGGNASYYDVLAALGEFGLRPPIAVTGGPNVELRQSVAQGHYRRGARSGQKQSEASDDRGIYMLWSLPFSMIPTPTSSDDDDGGSSVFAAMIDELQMQIGESATTQDEMQAKR